MTMTTTIELLYVPIDLLKLSKWDVRRFKETEEEFESLKNSIQENGLIYTLTVAKMTSTGDLIVVAGRRRLRALRTLGWKTVLVIVQFENVTETELRRITLIENLQRKNLVDIEKGFGIVAIYEAAGYTGDQAIHGAKSIDNWFTHNTNNKVDWDSFMHNCVMHKQIRKRQETSPLRYDPKFVEICKSIDRSPKYQYQLMQIVLQLDPDVLIEAQKAELPTHKKLLLTKSKLKEHPKIQKNLIPKLKKLGIRQGEVLINQKLRDIETGYIVPPPEGTGDFLYSEKPASEREIVKAGSTDKILALPTAIELDIVAVCNKLMFLLTGRAITKGENRYTKEIVDKNKERMFKIVMSFNKDIHDIDALSEPLETLEYTVKSMLEIVRQERDTSEKQKELNKK